MSNATTKNTIRIYGAGGCGINIVNSVNLPSDAAGFPESFFALIDTSRSNMPPKHSPKGDVYLIPGIDGSGKNRKFAHEQGIKHIDDMLVKCPPKNFNIVVFGLSGGSGSVLGPLLMEELIRRGESVIGICVTSTASAKETQNAWNTIGTLQNLSTKILNQPIVCCFYANTSVVSRLEVDKRIESDIRALAMLTSGTNSELDKKDIANWLHYDKVTKVAPQLIDLVVYLATKDAVELSGITAVSVANLLTSKSNSELDLGQLYSCVGYLSTAAQESVSHEIPPMHFIISNQFMADRIKTLSEEVARYAASEQALRVKEILKFEDGDAGGFLF